jgi:hypothetical protein
MKIGTVLLELVYTIGAALIAAVTRATVKAWCMCNKFALMEGEAETSLEGELWAAPSSSGFALLLPYHM